MLLKELKALKTVAGQDRFGNPIAGKDMYDERRVYVVDGDMETIESFMSMEAATRAIKNNPKKFVKGEFQIKTGKELNKLQTVTEESLETKSAEDLWAENADGASSYVSTAEYLVRPVKDPGQGAKTMYEVFRVIGTTRKPFGKFTSLDLADTLKPIRPNQTPDAEGFIVYTDPKKVEAFKYSGDPVKVQISDDESIVVNKGDYLTRVVDGSHFEYSIEEAGDFEATLKKA